MLLPAAAGHRLALRERELLLERLDLEEEDVAARLGRPLAAADVARAGVVGDEVAGLTPSSSSEIGVPAVDGERRAVAARSGTTRLACRRAPIHQLEPVDAVVVVGARLDVDFLERRDLPSPAGRTMRTSGGRSSSTRMKYSVSPALDSPSRSARATRYDPSALDRQRRRWPPRRRPRERHARRRRHRQGAAVDRAVSADATVHAVPAGA